jgi:hypothetical protein
MRLQRGYGCREVVAPGLAPVKAVEAVGDHDPLSAHPERTQQFRVTVSSAAARACSG